jgi:hypothetical protein
MRGTDKSHFSHIVKALEHLTTYTDKQISSTEYELFCKEFVFEKLQGVSFGEAFCKRFDFSDIFLKRLSDDTAKDHIEKLGYIKK